MEAATNPIHYEAHFKQESFQWRQYWGRSDLIPLTPLEVCRSGPSEWFDIPYDHPEFTMIVSDNPQEGYPLERRPYGHYTMEGANCHTEFYHSMEDWFQEIQRLHPERKLYLSISGFKRMREVPHEEG